MTNHNVFGLVSLCVLSAILLYAASESDAFVPSGRAPDFKSIEDVAERKAAFFSFIRMRLNSVNAEVARDRKTVLALRTSGKLSLRERKVLERLSERYSIDPFDSRLAEGWDRLLARIDTVPESLALAQAANESAWGTSRFAREGKNYFGQWCYRAGCGIVPARRGKGEAHEVRSFESARDSVAAYVHNLNTQAAFKEFRSLRAAIRARGEALSGLALAGGLGRYSSRGQEYVKDLRQMIRANDLEGQVGAGPKAQAK